MRTWNRAPSPAAATNGYKTFLALVIKEYVELKIPQIRARRCSHIGSAVQCVHQTVPKCENKQGDPDYRTIASRFGYGDPGDCSKQGTPQGKG